MNYDLDALKFHYKPGFSVFVVLMVIPILFFAFCASLFLISSNIIIFISFITFLSFIVLIIMFQKIEINTMPRNSNFDIINQKYIVEGYNGQKLEIPFSDISSFEMRNVITRPNSVRTSSSYNFFIVYILKKDGSWWDIYKIKNDKNKAEQILDSLRSKVILNNKNNLIKIENEFPTGINIQEESDRIIYRWKSQVSLTYNTFGILAVAGFFSILLNIFLAKIPATTFVIPIFFIAFYYILKPGLIPVYYSCGIDKNKISFFKKDVLIKEIPVNKLTDAQYSYSEYYYNNNIFNQEIFLLNSNSIEKIKEITNQANNTTSNYYDLSRALKSITSQDITLPCYGFTIFNAYRFQQHIKKSLKRFS